MPRGKALGRVPPMGRADGAAEALNVIASTKRRALARRSRPKTTAARKAAAGKPCMIRIPGVCGFDSSTTVLCHYRLGTGGGMKPHDAQGAWGCNKCHDAVDGRLKTTYSTNELRLMHAEGVFRTQEAIRREAA
jgi:hypothetical protein